MFLHRSCRVVTGYYRKHILSFCSLVYRLHMLILLGKRLLGLFIYKITLLAILFRCLISLFTFVKFLNRFHDLMLFHQIILDKFALLLFVFIFHDLIILLLCLI